MGHRNDTAPFGQGGFTLLEILVALGMLSILISLSTALFMVNLRNNMNTQIRYEAIQAAQRVLDELRFEDPSTLGDLTHQDVVIGDRTYGVDIEYCAIDDICFSTDMRHIAVDVSYRNSVVYETDTVFSKF